MKTHFNNAIFMCVKPFDQAWDLLKRASIQDQEILGIRNDLQLAKQHEL
jgi:hypothetical protein